MTESCVGTLAIYAQPAWHDDAIILGDREGLAALRAAIDAALATGYGTADTFVQDGEGYTLHVAMGSYTELEPVCTPYMDDYAGDYTGTEPEALVAAKRAAKEATE